VNRFVREFLFTRFCKSIAAPNISNLALAIFYVFGYSVFLDSMPYCDSQTVILLGLSGQAEHFD